MDNFRLGEASSEWVEDETVIAKEQQMTNTIKSLEQRIRILENRLDLIMALKVNNLDISKFSFGIKPLSNPLNV